VVEPITATGILGGDEPGVAAATTVRTSLGLLTVYALGSTEQTERSTHAVTVALAVVLPLLVVGAAALAWMLAGRALRPVEAIRQEVGEVSAGDLHRRVPVPPGDDEISRLARTMNDLLARLEAASERQRRFVSDASHELRSPLASLMAQVEVAGTHAETADWPAVARVVQEEGGRLSRLVDDLLLLARSDEGALVAGHDLVDLDELALAEGERLRALGRVAVDLRGVSAGRVLGDRHQLARMVRNLTDNAERHATSTVRLSVSQRDGWVQLEVADDGPGIPEADRRRVFERFARLDEARDRPEGGTGLGLAIVGAVAAAHGGSVAVGESQGGARMVVRLPVDPDAPGDAGDPADPDDVADPGEAAGPGQ
jgi:signal transduction histidine kinase